MIDLLLCTLIIRVFGPWDNLFQYIWTPGAKLSKLFVISYPLLHILLLLASYSYKLRRDNIFHLKYWIQSHLMSYPYVTKNVLIWIAFKCFTP